MIHFTGSNDIGDPTKGNRYNHEDHEDQCMYCKAYGVKFIDTDNDFKVCNECAVKYVTDSLHECGICWVNGFMVRKNTVNLFSYGYYFVSSENPLTMSFTDPTIEGGLKRINQ